MYVVAVLCAILAIYCFIVNYRNGIVSSLAVSAISQFVFAFAAIAELNGVASLTIDQKKWWRGYLLSSPLIFGFAYLKVLRSHFPAA